MALFFDMLAEGARQAVRASWIGDTPGNGPAYDGVGAAGNELSLPRYPQETWAQYHARLQRAWTDWPLAGHESIIRAQLAAAGFPGAQIFYALDWPGWADWWSQFVVFYPAGTHTVTGGAEIGAFTIGDGTIIGVDGISVADILALRLIIKKFKPAHWVCRAIVFELSGWTIGTGHVIGEPGLEVGGSHTFVGVT